MLKHRGATLAVFLIAGLCFALQPSLASAQTPAKREDPVWMKEIKDLRLVLNVPGMDRASVRRNTIYKKVGDRDLKMDVYLPPGLRPGSQLPVVIFARGT